MNLKPQVKGVQDALKPTNPCHEQIYGMDLFAVVELNDQSNRAAVSGLRLELDLSAGMIEAYGNLYSQVRAVSDGLKPG